MEKEQVTSIFTLAGLKVLNIKPLIDGYGYPPSDTRYFITVPRMVWWFVKTEYGWIEIGLRKRVISIDWKDTNQEAVVTTDDVTKSAYSVHAWTDLKAVEYLKKLAEILHDNILQRMLR